MQRRIIVVEDDHLQEGPLVERLEAACPGYRIDSVRTECEFRERLPSLRADRPDLVIMDVMLRWDDPRRDPTEPPATVVREGFYRAGLRCVELMSIDPRLASVPIILYTILEKSDLDQDSRMMSAKVFYLRKSTDLDTLVRKVREFTHP
jgi:CheY-like chemotaxis protein